MRPIHHLICRYVVFCTAYLSLALYTFPVKAQFVPGGNYYSDAGVMGVATAAYQSAAQQQAYTANRQMQMTSSMARSAAWQNINRSMQTQAMSRPSSVPDTAQAARDWMFQNTAPKGYSRRPATLPPVSMSSPAPAVETSVQAAPREIMLWPTILKDPLFDDDRAGVEAPFRRAYADGKPLSIADYEGIIKTVERMKVSLKSFESQLVASEYDAVEQYLDSLIEDAQKRIKARE